MSIFRKVAVLLLLASFLAVPWVSAAGPGVRRSELAQVEPQALFDRAWAFLRSLWIKTGCNIDPSGRCAPEPALAIPGDTGCGIDPSGGCAPGPALAIPEETGCGLDPNGLCHS